MPWVEKYRPAIFDNIVLDSNNKRIFSNIIETNSFPNLLLYGPPGTGKTTTAINLINRYQERYSQKNKGLMIHLNASDERGIDIIRNQISQFVNAKALFSENGLKIVVLDEIDYMTKNAQQALKYLLQDYHENVRFCLICNYISRIDDSLQNELLHIRFNQLPVADIIDFLENISVKEKLSIPKKIIYQIQKMFKSDIRSMVNYIQSNQYDINIKKVVNDELWNNLSITIKHKDDRNTKQYVEYIQTEYAMSDIIIIKQYINYLIYNKKDLLCADFLNFCEYIIHVQAPNAEYLRNYFIKKIVHWAHLL